MIYTIIHNRKSYDLPKKTIAIMDEIDEGLRIDMSNLSLREKFDRLRMIIVDILGEENAIEILGSNNLDDMDLSDVTITFKKISDAYDKPIQDYNTGKTREALSQIPFDKISQLSKVTAEMPKGND